MTTDPLSNEPSTPTRPPVVWSAWARGAASALLVYHLGAVLTGPFSAPPTETGNYLRRVYLPYISATFLDHGYKFFAPDPGPSHVIRYELEWADGTRREGVFPDRQEHWPRLLYHRHFMLSEQILGLPDDPDLWTAAANETGIRPAPLESVFAESYARHLLSRHNALRVTLHYRMHLIPPPDEIKAGGRLDDPRWYRERKLGTWTGENT